MNIVSKRFKMKALGARGTHTFDGASAPAIKGTPSGVSEKYAHVSSQEVLDVFARYGWEPVKSTQKTRKLNSPKTRESAAHMVELHNPTMAGLLTSEVSERLGGLVPTLYVKNSHDGSTPLEVTYGFIRLVCQNGLAFGEVFGSFKVRHYGKAAQMSELEGKLAAVAANFLTIVAQMLKMDSVECTDAMRKMIALKGLELKYGLEVVARLADENKLGETLDSIAKPMRLEDKANTVWSVMNVVQEDMVNALTLMPKVEGTKRTRSITNKFRANDFTSELVEFTHSLAIAA
jgi:hypothetical protein